MVRTFGLTHLALTVRDVERAFGFYESVFGMVAVYRRPDFLQAIRAASLLHFSDGALTRAQHEMIASYVSALNRCHF